MRCLVLIVLLSSTVLAHIAHARERVLVVANSAESTLQLSKSEIRNLFMGGSLDGLSPVEFESGTHIRFSGRSNPPSNVSNIEEMVTFLIEHESSVGYLPEGTSIPNGLTVVYISI